MTITAGVGSYCFIEATIVFLFMPLCRIGQLSVLLYRAYALVLVALFVCLVSAFLCLPFQAIQTSMFHKYYSLRLTTKTILVLSIAS